MQFQLLREEDSIINVILRPAFAISYCTTTLLTLGVSYYMEKLTVESSSAPAKLVTSNLFINVLSYTLFVSGIVFTNSFQLTHAVAVGRSPPIQLARLQSLPWPICSICGREGDRSLTRFLLQTLAFPGLTVLLGLHVLSAVVNGIDRALDWRMPLKEYLAWTMLWRLIVSGTIFFLNYLCAHNPTQTLLIPPKDSTPPSSQEPSSSTGKKQE